MKSHIIEFFIEQHNLTHEEAVEYLSAAKDMILAGEDAEEIVCEYLGLGPEYIGQILEI